MTLKATKTYETTVSWPGQPDETTSGTWEASSDVLTLHEAGIASTQQFNYTLSATTLTLSGADDEFDFNDDGVMEPAKVNATAVRR